MGRSRLFETAISAEFAARRMEKAAGSPAARNCHLVRRIIRSSLCVATPPSMGAILLNVIDKHSHCNSRPHSSSDFDYLNSIVFDMSVYIHRVSQSLDNAQLEAAR